MTRPTKTSSIAVQTGPESPDKPRDGRQAPTAEVLIDDSAESNRRPIGQSRSDTTSRQCQIVISAVLNAL